MCVYINHKSREFCITNSFCTTCLKLFHFN